MSMSATQTRQQIACDAYWRASASLPKRAEQLGVMVPQSKGLHVAVVVGQEEEEGGEEK